MSIEERLATIIAEAEAAKGEIPEPCDHDHDEEPEEGPTGGEPAPDDMPVWDAPEDPFAVTGTIAWIFGMTQPEDRADAEQLFSFPFPVPPNDDAPPIQLRDVESREDGISGVGCFMAGDRIAYQSAHVYFFHRDPGHHDLIPVFRVAIMSHAEKSIQVNDRGMPEKNPQGVNQYPYENPDVERVVVPPIAREWPGARITLSHQRGFGADLRHKGKGRQALIRYTIPAVAKVFHVGRGGGVIAENPNVKWWYQGNGIVTAEHAEIGTVARVIVTSLHERYEVVVEPDE